LIKNVLNSGAHFFAVVCICFRPLPELDKDFLVSGARIMITRRVVVCALTVGLSFLTAGVSHANTSARVNTASAAQLQLDRADIPVVGSAAYVVINQRTGEVLSERQADRVLPVASITKLMTAMVVLDSGQSLSEVLSVTSADIDRLKGTGSRLVVGARLTREEMLHIALMSSENRAASSLARHYPGGERAFVEAMNIKAKMLGMWNTRFVEATGLDPRNVSSAKDLVNLVQGASSYPLIREFSTADQRVVRVRSGQLRYGNSNGLVREPDWSVSLSKTGFIREAGRCLVMQTWVKKDPVIMILLNADGNYTRTADAKRIKQWIETDGVQRLTTASR
jgi:D-alanyl-D-alanine endopeptidase (penicillin-binding protein 7)